MRTNDGLVHVVVMEMMLSKTRPGDEDNIVNRFQSSSQPEHGCNECGARPSFLTPGGLRCRDHMHQEEDWDDWIPLARKDSRQRTVRPVGGSAGNG